MNIHEESETCIIYYHILGNIKASLIIISHLEEFNYRKYVFNNMFIVYHNDNLALSR